MSYHSEAVAWCNHLDETEPTAQVELRYCETGRVRPWHPEYPECRSLGLWEDLLRQYDPFQQILQFVHQATGKEAILAGGCIRDFVIFERPDEIKDFDCFLLDTMPSEDDALVDQVIDAVEAAGGTWEYDYPLHRYARLMPFSRLCLNLTLPGLPEGKQVQVIASQGKTPDEVVARFDWTACMFWFDGKAIGAEGMRDFAAHELTLNTGVDKELKRVLERGFYLERKTRKSPLALTLPPTTILHLASLMHLDPQVQPGSGVFESLDC